MLVLDRKVNEGFWIDGRIFVKVLGIGRTRMKLGIEAPADVEIVREELLARPAVPTTKDGEVPGAPSMRRLK